VGSSGDKAGACQYCQMVRARQARSRGVAEVNQWLNPLKRGTGSNLVDMGRATVRAGLFVRGQRLRSRLLMPVGRPSPHVCGFGDGEAVAAKLDVDPINRDMVNVGTTPGSPFPASSQLAGGQAHRRLTAPGWGGGSVVVRDRESRSHGEGTQQVRSRCDGMPGGRW
jgi:hypothetical protein